ncbi:uncharacterized protein [Hyperolius riggenbachi]|uniref:uncharacterized protein n=1 Tax=Hyperolius riggenbachi TaxID=752182 RepID=UPI0035A38DB8
MGEASGGGLPPPQFLCRPQDGGHTIQEGVNLADRKFLVRAKLGRSREYHNWNWQEECQYTERHEDLYKDIIMENQPPLTSPGGSSNRKPPERCTGPLYSKDCPQDVHTDPLYFQGYDHVVVKVEEEDESYVKADQRSTEKGDMMRPIKVEQEETYERGDQQSMECGDMMGTNKEEAEETYVRNDQQSMEEDVIVRTIKEEEEETYVMSDQECMEEDEISTLKLEEKIYVRNNHLTTKKGQIIQPIKKGECYLDLRTDGQDVENTSEGHLISPPDYNAEDNGVTQYSPGGNPITGNTHHRLYHEDRSLDPSNPEEASDRSFSVSSKTHLKPHGANRSSAHYKEDSSAATSHRIISRGRRMERSIERSMVSSTYCIEDLIRKVQANPCIFDKGDKKHSDHNYCRKIWTRITSSFFSHWNELPSKIQNQKIEEMKRKWRSVKDTFKKELQKKKNLERSGSVRNYRPRYRHFEILSFLTPYFEGRSTEDRFSSTPVVFDENAEDTQHSLVSSVDAEDLQSESTPPSLPIYASRPTFICNPEKNAPLKKRQKGNKSIDVDIEDQTNTDVTNIFQSILTYMQNNMEQQQQLMRRNETDHYALANSLIPLFKKIHIDLYPDLNVDLIRVCQTYISKSKEREQMAITNGHNPSSQPSAEYGPRYARGPDYCRPPAQPRRTPQSNRQHPHSYSQQYPDFRGPTYHVMESSQSCLGRETPPQPERTYMQALFDDHD